MGRKDAITKEYTSDNRIFADLFNFFLYGGRQVIRPEALKTRDSAEVAIPYGTDQKSVPAQKQRDVLKVYAAKEAGGVTYLLLGLENQSDQHYAMPCKNMMYDAMNYSSQVSQAGKSHRSDHKADRAEYLSGFTKDDRLMPVVTLVLFWGAGEWDAPRSLHEMFGDVDEEVLKYVPDYRINLIVPAEIDNFEKFTSEIGPVLKFIRESQDKKRLKELVYTDERYKSMDPESARLLNEVAGLKLDLTAESKGGRVDMCKGWDDYAEDRVKSSARDTVIRMIRKGAQLEFIIDTVTGLSEEEIREIYEQELLVK
ncbi:MAG: Rpn family recombination-promoting nuclease/putative transposase [Eubacteriales bacterium]|nr:Rpn family recombination-promoting nuclease/putative transposase [Eubacteriales bacterium]